VRFAPLSSPATAGSCLLPTTLRSIALLAHMSLDPVLVEAFRCGEDIHTRTAAEVFGVPPCWLHPICAAAPKRSTSASFTGISAFGLARS